MRKKTIALQTLLGLGLYTVSNIAVFSKIPGSTFFSPVMPSVETASVFVFVGVSIALVGVLLVLIGTINCLVKQAKQQQWAWFICTLFFGPPCAWLYLLAIPGVPVPPKLVYTQPEQPAYQPYMQGYGISQSLHEQPEVSQESGQHSQYLEQQPQYEDLMVMYPRE